MADDVSNAFKGKKVILIDDERLPQSIYKKQLEDLGFEVIVFSSFSEFNSQAGSAEKVDLIISDNNVYDNAEIPGVKTGEKGHISCIDWAQNFRAIEGNPNRDTPVILYTNTHNEERRILQALDKGIEGFLHKSATALNSLEAKNLYLHLMQNQIQRGEEVICTKSTQEKIYTRLKMYVKGDLLTQDEADILSAKMKQCEQMITSRVDTLVGSRPFIMAKEVEDWGIEESAISKKLKPFLESSDKVIPIQDIAAFVLFLNVLGKTGVFQEKDADALLEHLRVAQYDDIIAQTIGFIVNNPDKNEKDRMLAVGDEVFWKLLDEPKKHPIHIIQVETLFKYATTLMDEVSEQITEAEAYFSEQRGKKTAGIVLIEKEKDCPGYLKRDLGDMSILKVAKKIQDAISELLGLTTMRDIGASFSLE